MIRPPASSSVWLSGRPLDFPGPRYRGGGFLWCCFDFSNPSPQIALGTGFCPFSVDLPKGWELNHHHTITSLVTTPGGGMWLKSVPSRYRRADLPSVRIVLLKYAELLVLSIAALHYKRNHSSKGSRKFWIWAGDALFAGVVGGVNRELNWFKLNQSYRLRKVGCLPARDMLVRD